MFAVGEEVICVANETPCPGCGDLVGPADKMVKELGLPEIGKHYIVGRSGMGFCALCRCRLPLMNAVGHDHPWFGWNQALFRRPIVDEEFDEVKEREPVDA